MFHHVGSDICQVSFESTSPAGVHASVPLRQIATTRSRITRLEDARILGKKYCSRLPRGSELRVFVKCGDRRLGWVTAADGEEDLCASPR